MCSNMRPINKCLNCSSDDIKFLYISRDRMFDVHAEYQMKQCQKCGLAFINPQPSSKELEKHYPSEKYYAYTERKRRTGIGLKEYYMRNLHKNNLITKIIAFITLSSFGAPKFIRKGNIIDVGCGKGDDLLIFKDLGWNTFGIEIEKNAATIARNKGLDVKNGDFTLLSSYPNNFFDVVRLYHVVEHLNNPKFLFKLAKEKLKKDGELIIATPNYNSLGRIVFRKYWGSLQTPRHLFLFSQNTLTKMAGEYNFVVRDIEYSPTTSIVGSIRFFLEDKSGMKNISFLKSPLAIIFFYPIEWLLAFLKQGESFTMRFK